MKISLCMVFFLIVNIISISGTISGQQQQQQQQQQTNSKKCSITFEPKDYQGNYRLIGDGYDGKTEYKKHTSLDLSSGNGGIYNIEIGGRGSMESLIPFRVAEDCTVSEYKKTSKPSSATFKDKTITFKNVSIEINPQDYLGVYYVKGFSRNFYESSRGKNPFVMVPNVDSFVSLHGTGIGSDITFYIENDGKLSRVVNFTAASANGNKLIFNNVKISVNPTTYTGDYNFGGIRQQGKLSDLTVVPGVLMPLYIPDATPVRIVTPWVNFIYPAIIDVPDSTNQNYKFVFCPVP